MGFAVNSQPKMVTGNAGYVLEDVPHLSDYIPDLPVRINTCYHQDQFEFTSKSVNLAVYFLIFID